MLQKMKVKQLAVLLLLSISSIVNAQTNPELFTNVSEDSLQKILLKIDDATYGDLQKVRESFVYRNRVAPSEQNKRILQHVEKTIATRKPD